MGQYYHPVNIDKRQYLNPHAFGEGLKLLEFGSSAEGTLTGLTILMAVGNGRGGGDLHSENSIVGSWAGDRIMILGDYAEITDHEQLNNVSEQELMDTIHGIWHDGGHEATVDCRSTVKPFEDISQYVMEAMADDSYLRDSLLAAAAFHQGWGNYQWNFLFTEEEIKAKKDQLDAERDQRRQEIRPDMIIGPKNNS